MFYQNSKEINTLLKGLISVILKMEFTKIEMQLSGLKNLTRKYV